MATASARRSKSDGQTFNIYAKGTVLATGGFGNNQEMMERFTPVDAAQVAYFYGSAGQTGEGILMAEDIGAAVHEKGARLGMSYVVGDGTNAELTSGRPVESGADCGQHGCPLRQ